MEPAAAGSATLAILIDADNARPSIVQGLMDEVAKLGRATVRRIYGDWTTPNLGPWKSALLDHSIQPESGKRVYGFGELKTPKPFVAACDRFVYTEVLGRAEGSPLPRKSAAEMDRDKEFVVLVGDAIDDSADDGGWANLGAVGNIIRNKKPDFDSRNYGYKKLWELLDASSYFETTSIDNVVMVRREKKKVGGTTA